MSADYEVGYGKPPRAAQYKKGQSGNPNGRRRGRSIRALLEKVLHRRVIMRHGGHQTSVPAVEAVFMAVLNQGIHGRMKAVELLFDMAERWGLVLADRDVQAPEDAPSFSWTEEETLLVERLLSAMQDAPREPGEVIKK